MTEDNVTDTELVDRIMDLIECYGPFDGSHHKQWVIDQIARLVMSDNYEEWAEAMRNGEDGPDTYEWDEGIAP